MAAAGRYIPDRSFFVAAARRVAVGVIARSRAGGVTKGRVAKQHRRRSCLFDAILQQPSAASG